MEAGVNSDFKKIISNCLIQIKIHNVNIIPVSLVKRIIE